MEKPQGLSNQVLGKVVEPLPGLEHIWKLEPNRSREFYGMIQAAWVQDGNVKFLVGGPNGDLMEVFATHVKVKLL